MSLGDFSVGRFMWWAPWGVTRPWLPRFMRGSDEWGNDSIMIVLPFLLGCLIVFYGKFDRSQPVPDMECRAPETRQPEDCVCESTEACRRTWT